MVWGEVRAPLGKSLAALELQGEVMAPFGKSIAGTRMEAEEDGPTGGGRGKFFLFLFCSYSYLLQFLSPL